MKIIFRSLLLIIASLFVFTGCRSGGPTLQDTQQTDSQTSEKPIPSPLPTEPYLPISFKPSLIVTVRNVVHFAKA